MPCGRKAAGAACPDRSAGDRVTQATPVPARYANSRSSKIATARVHPAEAPRILCGKQLM
jgi:hypothetical protein